MTTRRGKVKPEPRQKPERIERKAKRARTLRPQHLGLDASRRAMEEPDREAARLRMRLLAGFASHGINGEAREAMVQDIASRALALARDRSAMLERLERLIALTDRVLRIAQPPKSGKIGVRWWITHGRPSRSSGDFLNGVYDSAHPVAADPPSPSSDPGLRSGGLAVLADPSRIRRPVLVRWLRSARRPGRWRAERILSFRENLVARDGTSPLNRAAVIRLARLGVDLIKAYHTQLDAFLGLRAGSLNGSGFWMRMDEALATLTDVHAGVVETLRREGYTVDARSAGMIEAFERGEDVLPDARTGSDSGSADGGVAGLAGAGGVAVVGGSPEPGGSPVLSDGVDDDVDLDGLGS